jgi:GH25 family lysozyme M1 (1,4-beta-N-acetylmuramidase)
MIYGLDGNHWVVDKIDWPHWYDEGYRFCWNKTTEGIDFVDWEYETLDDRALDAGYMTGGYHYFRAKHNGTAQGNHFYSHARPDSLMKPSIDVERINNRGFSKAVFRSRLRACLLRTEYLFGVKPVIYTSKWAWLELVGSVSWAKDYDLWVANYTTASGPALPPDWDDYLFWQFARIPVDRNRFNGTLAELKQWAGALPPSGPTVLAPGLYEVR